jgi:hypothetical protein
MPNPALPFRSTAPGPVDRAVVSIEEQATGVRRRVNRLVVERALFVVGGASFTSLTLLVLSAVAVSRTSFAVITWLMLSGLTIVSLASLRHAARDWYRKRDAALRIDHRAALDDRLATIVTTASAARQSRLWEYLLHENLRLLPRWHPRAFQPRALPRSIWFFGLSLLIALSVLWIATRRGGGAGFGFGPGPGRQGAPEQEQVQEQQSAPPSDDGSSETAGTSVWSELPESLRQAILGSRATQNFSGEAPEKTLPVENERDGPAIASQRLNNRGPVRSVPASPDAARAAGKGSLAGGATSPPPVPPPNAKQDAAAQNPARGEAPKALERVETGRPRNPTSQSRIPPSKSGGSGSGGAGSGIGGDKDGLFGERQAGGAKGAGSFALDLDAMRSTQPSKEGDRDEAPMAPSSRLAEDQRLDDAVRRAQVPVEYEAIVQRIFNRGEEPSDRPRPEGK